MDMSMGTGIQHTIVTAWNIAEGGLGLSQWLLEASQHCSMYRTGPFTFQQTTKGNQGALVMHWNVGSTCRPCPYNNCYIT